MILNILYTMALMEAKPGSKAWEGYSDLVKYFSDPS